MNRSPRFEVLPEFEITPSLTFDELSKNVKHTSNLGLRPITDCDAWRSDNRIAVVGGGPSLKHNLKELRRYKYIMACGSVHDYLVDNNIFPTWCAVTDPDEIMIKYLQRPSPHTKYLLASQCHPKLFDHLRYDDVFVWHAGGSPEENQLIKFPDTDYVLGGGCTIGTRAIVIATHFGFENITLFGFDSCIVGDEHHAYDFVDPSKETLGHIFDIKVGSEDSPTFKVAGYMVGQIRDFQALCAIYAKTIKFTIVGDGPLAEIISLASKQAQEQ